jgi:phytoene desaturase
MSRRVVIVGAGPGGLAAGMLLAKAGLDVKILERLPCVGGRTSTIGGEGFSFDLGPTFFLYPRVLSKIFTACGRRLTDAVRLVKLDPQYRLVFGSGGELSASPDVGRMERALAALCPDDAAGFRRFLADNRVKLDSFRPVLERPFLSWRDLFTWDMLRMLPLVRPWASLHDELGRYFRDERIRLAFTFQSKYLGMSPFQCPSLFSILSYLEYEHGVFHPVGGCGAVSRAMADAAADMGADVRLGEEVRGIDFDGRRAVAVRTDRGTYPCDAMVINADFAHAMTRLVPDGLRRRWSDRKLSRKKFSCSTFMLYLGIEGRYDDLAHHTIYLAEDYEQNLRDIEVDHVLSENPSFYVQNAGVTDPTLAPRGHSTLYVLAPVTHQHGNVDWKREAPAFRKRMLKQLEKVGVTDLERRIRFEKMVTPAEWEGDFAIHRGATFNLAHNLLQMLHLRPRNRFEDLDGVYLVGGGTHPGSGLPVIYESACISSRLLLQDAGVGTAFLDETVEPALSAAAPPGVN